MSTPDSTKTAAVSLSQMGPFENLFKTYYPLVCNVVYKYVGDASKVEDIAQEIFTELWLKRDQIHIHTSVPAYLRRMAISRALNHIRNAKKHDWDVLDPMTETMAGIAFQQPEIIQRLDEEELRAILSSAIEKLPEKCRIIFLMSRHDELTYAEIADIQGLSIKTVENQIGKALKYLRMAVSENRG